MTQKTAALAAVDARLPHFATFAQLLAAMSDIACVAVGEYTGAGSSTPVVVPLNFVPKFVVVFDEAGGGVAGFWINATNDLGNTHKTKTGTTYIALSIVTNGIVLPVTGTGFNIGAGSSVDADLGASAHVFSYVAIG